MLFSQYLKSALTMNPWISPYTLLSGKGLSRFCNRSRLVLWYPCSLWHTFLSILELITVLYAHSATLMKETILYFCFPLRLKVKCWERLCLVGLPLYIQGFIQSISYDRWSTSNCWINIFLQFIQCNTEF